ncbi:X-Pro aminopeptidase, partial [Methylobacterium indicum]|uniref:aminopeptidase P family N-terminal domain-containing protein n=1 Tax=Methylobacterium indicum TaxID=1775910 RepID=UPI0007DEFCEB
MSQTARFQSFEDPSHREGAARVAALRAAMAQRGVAGFVVPRADEHQSEYVPANAERLAWLTGFTGSAGTAIVLADKAALVVDGRYTLQAAEQVDTAIVTPVPLAETSVEAWIEANLPAGGVLAYDPWLHTPDGLARLERAAEAAGGRVEATPLNLVDLVWIDRPAAPRAPVVPHPETLARHAAPAKLD